MRLILIAALGLCLSSAVWADDSAEEAIVTQDEDPAEEPVEIPYTSPTVGNKGHRVYFAEHFDNPEEFEARWVRSQTKKEGADEEIAKYDGMNNC